MNFFSYIFKILIVKITEKLIFQCGEKRVYSNVKDDKR